VPDDTHSRLIRRADAASIGLSGDLAARLVVFYDLLRRWNRKVNLTSLEDSDEALDRLLIEPVAAARYLPFGPRLMDVGSGGGSPAIPLALALSSAQVVMIESKSRKGAFLREAIRQLELPAQVVEGRFEDFGTLASFGHRMTVVSARAVQLGARELAILRSFLAPDGLIALFRSSSSAPPDVPVGLDMAGTYPLVPSLNSSLSLLKRSA